MMKWIDKVEVCRSTACDLLHGLFRLNNNDRFLEHLKPSLNKGDFEQDRIFRTGLTKQEVFSPLTLFRNSRSFLIGKPSSECVSFRI